MGKAKREEVVVAPAGDFDFLSGRVRVEDRLKCDATADGRGNLIETISPRSWKGRKYFGWLHPPPPFLHFVFIDAYTQDRVDRLF